MIGVVLCVTVSLGDVPDGGALADAGVPLFSSDARGGGDVEDPPAVRAAKQTSSLMALLNTSTMLEGPTKAAKVWLGEGLGSLSKRIYDKMMRWEFMDLGEFRPRSVMDKVEVEGDTEKLVVLPGFEVTQARKKPINNIITWVQCFARYTAAMASKFPDCTPGFMSHMLTVLKAYVEVEDPAWRLYERSIPKENGINWSKVVARYGCVGLPGSVWWTAPEVSWVAPGGRKAGQTISGHKETSSVLAVQRGGMQLWQNMQVPSCV